MQKSFFLFLVLTCLYSSNLFAQNKKKTENSNYGATIERNLEAHTLLERAKNFIESKKYQDSVIILKFIIEQYPNVLITTEDKFYIPFREKVFELINSLPDDAKNLFLVEINSISLGLFKKAMEEVNEPLLEEIFSKYYLGDLGDDAAYQLGVIALDKCNFIKATHYFEKALYHPQCSLNKEKIKLCLYYLYAVTNKKKKSQEFNEQLNKVSYLKSDLLKIDNAVSEYLKISASKKVDENILASLKKEFWTTVWQQKIENYFKPMINVENQRRGVVRRNRNIQIEDGSENSFYDEDAVISDWKKNFWYPVNNSVVNEKGIVFRKNDQLTCFALDNMKKVLWEANIESSSRSTFSENYYDSYNNNNNATRIPSTRDEILAFSDQIGKLMQEQNGVLYVISNHEKTGTIVPFAQRRWGGNQGNVKVEGNYIFAIDMKSGKKLWKIGENNNKKDPFYNAIFLHLPIETPYGLFVTYQLNNDIYSATITKQREVVWNKYMCSSESSYEMSINNAAAVLGDDYLFITIDYGVVIKINAIDGNYCWIKRYGLNIQSNVEYYMTPAIKMGVEINSLLYNLGNLVVLPSDMNSIIVINAESGEEVFKIEDGFEDFRRYLIGADNSGYYLAGSKGIRKYPYNSKQFIWQADIKGNFGKGILSGQNILFPSNRNLYLVDKDSGKKVSMLTVNLNKTNIPLGNIATSGSYLVSTSYDSVNVTNEVDLIIKNLTDGIALNKSDELFHRRGLLYFEKGNLKNAFEDFSEAIRISEGNVEKRNIYSESILDLFEKMHETGLEKKYQSSMNELSKILNDGNQKSFWFFLQGEFDLDNKKYDEALGHFILSFSQPNGLLKSRVVKENDRFLTSSFAALLKAISMVDQKLITEDSLIATLNSSENAPEEFILLSMLEKFSSVNFKKWVFKYYLKKCNNDFVSSKIKSFMFCLSNSDDPIISLSARYYLFLQNIQMKEYWTAAKSLEFLKSQNAVAVIYTENGQESLLSKINKYQVNAELLSEIFNPSIRQITEPPLAELWRSSKKFNNNSDVVLIAGNSLRPEYVEKNIFIHNKQDNKIYCCDNLSGDIKWSLEIPNDKKEVRNNENTKTAEFYLRMEGIGLLNCNQKDCAVDFATGKNIWSIPNEKAESLDMGSGCLVRYKPHEITVYDAFNGKKMYSLNIKDDLKKVFAYRGRLIVLNLGATNFSIYNLYTGEKIKDVDFEYSLKSNFNLLLADLLVLQKSDNEIISYSIKTGQSVWSNSFQGYPIGNNYLFNVDDTNILMYCQNGFIYNVSGVDGKIVWQYEIPERFMYRMIDIYPVSGNESFIVMASSQIKQNKDNSSSQDFYFIFDMKKGILLNKVVVDVNNQEIWRQKAAWNVAFKGDVIPKISLMNNGNNNNKINFIRKRDNGIVKKCFIELKSNNENEIITAKGHVFFVISNREVTAYGNSSIIESQNKKIKTLAEALNEK